MGITHVTRDDRWISTAPKRVLLYQALGWEPPVLCHLPLVNGTDGRPLAKRHGSMSVTQFHELGYLPDALFNFLAFLGWAPGEGEEREIFSREELTELFDLFRINKSPAVFSYKKLDWMNGVYIRNLSQAELLERLLPFWQKAGLVPDPCPAEELDRLRPIVPLVQERLKRLSEIVELTAFLFREVETPAAEDLVGKKMTPGDSLTALRRARGVLAEVEPFEAQAMETPMRALAEELGIKAGQLFGIVRWAVTGQRIAPPLFGSLEIVGRELTLNRLDAAEAVLEAAV
jgi:glutamyl-tRNA synthetase